MPSWLAVALVLPAAAVAVADWRKGLFAMLVVAFLQDPARKLAADKPVYFTVLVGVVFAVVYLRAQSNRLFLPTQIPGWKHFLRLPSMLILLMLLVQAVNSILRYGNPMITGISALSYLAPLPAMLAGYWFAVKEGRAGVVRWMTAYLAGAIVVLPGILLEYLGIDWRVLGDVGEGFQLFQQDTILTAHAGFFRASEVAAWHTATVVCFLVLLSSLRKLSARQIAGVVAIAVGLLALGILTGRRKIFVEIVIFLSVYVSLLMLFGRGGVRLASAVFFGGLLAYGAIALWVVEKPAEYAGNEAPRYQRYAERSASVGTDVADRVVGLGIETVQWAVEGYGWLGGGLGIASQGAQHFGGGAEVYGGAGEGGLGKITAELGVPGLVIAIWFGVAALRYGRTVLKFVSGRSPQVERLAYGLAAFLVANLAVFLVATQVFGDLFVLLILGLASGFFVATPVLAEREHAQRSAVRGPSPAGAPFAAAGLAGRVGRP
jgi:hypothetical protein